MWTCPNCKQTTPELLSVKTDKDRVEKNNLYAVKYKAEIEKYNAREENYRRIVENHNKNKSWFESKWYLSTFENLYICTLSGVWDDDIISEYPKIKVPELLVLKTRYIQCPQCGNKTYID